MGLIYIFGLVAGPLSCAYLLAWALTWYFDWLREKKHQDEHGADAKLDDKAKFISILSLRPKLPLHDQGLLWFGILVPLSGFLITGSVIWVDYTVDISAAGFQKFYDISKFPLVVLAGVIPISGLIARMHSTAQTAEQIDKADIQIKNTESQIDETRRKNNSDLYYAHKRDFLEYMTEALREFARPGEQELVYFYSANTLYSFAFAKSPPEKGAPEVNKANLELLDKSLIQVASQYHDIEVLLTKESKGRLLNGAEFFSIIENRLSSPTALQSNLAHQIGLSPKHKLGKFYNAKMSLSQMLNLLTYCFIVRNFLRDYCSLSTELDASDNEIKYCEGYRLWPVGIELERITVQGGLVSNAYSKVSIQEESTEVD